NNIDLSEMQVYAVYSDGSERELTADEYSVETEREKTLFKENVTVTVSYEGCSCSFKVFEE
ncbi:MAG: bacterial Ig-like domain-containing protein, partial [Acutalibacteraceae bacterium]